MKKKVLLLVFSFLLITGLSAQVVINELMHNPIGNDGGNMAGEWIELYCNGTTDCDISCFVITDGDWTIQIPSGTVIAAGDYFVIGNGTYATPPVDLNVETCGCTTGSSLMELTNGGEFVGIYDQNAAFLDGVEFGSPSDGNLPENEADQISNGVGACNEVTVDISGSSSLYSEVAAGGTNGTGVERVSDGVGAWAEVSEANSTPGSSNDVPVPVELLSFIAKLNKYNTSLSWTTASEENNSHFDIQHSTDGRNFTTLGKVTGLGTTSQTQHYNYVHHHPANGKNYYRLRQVDFDGAFEYSPTEVVTLTHDWKVQLQPTLANDRVTLLFNESVQAAEVVQLFDVAGRQVYATQIDPGTDQLDVAVGDLEKGMYFVRLSLNGEAHCLKFVRR